jgi:coenzyme F420-0:L-glutamate ligase / coenzyme F420-1:gamma-L-glutamate ligase
MSARRNRMNDYEQFLNLARTRRSIRRFADRPVPRETLLRVLEAGRWAPSNHNRQPWRFIVLEDKQHIRDLAEAIEQRLSGKLKSLPDVASAYAEEFLRFATCFGQAPVLILVLNKRPISFSAALLQSVRHPELVSGEPLSAAMAVQNLLLAAHALGLGACVLTAPLMVPEIIAEHFALPAGHDLTCLVALGYAAESPAPPRRKNLEQTVQFREAAPAA